jgi:tRNA A-37 threonylcarbamoyl transferase component Bud32
VVDHVHIMRGERSATALRDLLATPPVDAVAWMEQHTRLLKSDTHCRVGLLSLQQQALYLKLYLFKSATQGLLLRLGPRHNRALRSFDVAAELVKSDVPVPAPRACLQVPGGMLLLAEAITGSDNLHDVWRQRSADEEAVRWLRSAGEAIARLHLAGYAHGDCKWHNLLWTRERVYLVDLDGAGTAASGGASQARDLARFTLNAEELTVSPALYEQFLQAYLQHVGGSRDAVVNRMLPILGKLRDRHLARYGERGQRLF